MRNNQEIIIHQNQSNIEDFLKVENKECLNCIECESNICTSMTCDYYNMNILDINENKCIHKKKRTLEYYEDGNTKSLF